LVTGGGSGIGRGIVARVGEEGACVGVLERFADRVAQLRKDFDQEVVAVEGDVTRLADNPLHIALQPGDLASAYVMLASRANARGITGVVLNVDAGSSLRWSRPC
jgi:NAD(P)-dependent dehydrogenase (short-subunit alcohol dehydrogenase family)